MSRVYQVLKCGASSFHGRHFKIQYHYVVQAGIIGVHHQHTQHSCMILCDSSSRKWAGAKVVENNLQKCLIIGSPKTYTYLLLTIDTLSCKMLSKRLAESVCAHSWLTLYEGYFYYSLVRLTVLCIEQISYIYIYIFSFLFPH